MSQHTHKTTVVFDMDGTLLDLHFDNYYWLHHIPKRYAQARGIALEEAKSQLMTHMQQVRGSLQWYCLDYWQTYLNLPMLALKYEVRHKVALRPGAIELLKRLHNEGYPLLLFTNAHPDVLRFKLEQINLTPYFDKLISSHSFGAPKESHTAWQGLFQQQKLSGDRCVFVDDSIPVLTQAQKSGISRCFGIAQPDMSQPAIADAGFPLIHHFDQFTL